MVCQAVTTTTLLYKHITRRIISVSLSLLSNKARTNLACYEKHRNKQTTQFIHTSYVVNTFIYIPQLGRTLLFLFSYFVYLTFYLSIDRLFPMCYQYRSCCAVKRSSLGCNEKGWETGKGEGKMENDQKGGMKTNDGGEV